MGRQMVSLGIGISLQRIPGVDCEVALKLTLAHSGRQAAHLVELAHAKLPGAAIVAVVPTECCGIAGVSTLVVSGQRTEPVVCVLNPLSDAVGREGERLPE